MILGRGFIVGDNNDVSDGGEVIALSRDLELLAIASPEAVT